MKNQWRVIVGILLILVIVLFAVANNMTVPINFGFTTIQSPLILVIIGSALLGALILLLVSTSAMFRQKRTKAIEKRALRLSFEQREGSPRTTRSFGTGIHEQAGGVSGKTAAAR